MVQLKVTATFIVIFLNCIGFGFPFTQAQSVSATSTPLQSGSKDVTTTRPVPTTMTSILSSPSHNVGPKDVTTTCPLPATLTTILAPPLPGVGPKEIHCNLDLNNCEFLNVKGDDFDWILKKGPTSTEATGPSGDKTQFGGNGRYYYVEASGRRKGQRARLQFPPFRLNFQACLTFYYHMYGSDMGTLMVVVNGKLVWKLRGNQGNQWHIATVPILQTGQKKVTFEGVVGKGIRSDIAIDEISVVEKECWGPTVCVFAPNGAKG